MRDRERKNRPRFFQQTETGFQWGIFSFWLRKNQLFSGGGVGYNLAGLVEGVTSGLTAGTSQCIRISRTRGPRERQRRLGHGSREPVSEPRCVVINSMVKRFVDQTKRHLLQNELEICRRGGEPLSPSRLLGAVRLKCAALRASAFARWSSYSPSSAVSAAPCPASCSLSCAPSPARPAPCASSSALSPAPCAVCPSPSLRCASVAVVQRPRALAACSPYPDQVPPLTLKSASAWLSAAAFLFASQPQRQRQSSRVVMRLCLRVRAAARWSGATMRMRMTHQCRRTRTCASPSGAVTNAGGTLSATDKNFDNRPGELSGISWNLARFRVSSILISFWP